MRSFALVAAAAAALLHAGSVSAAPWNVPTNVRIVQKSNTDTAGRIYPTIQAALASIPATGTSAPSATNPYVVKVMPGVYDLGTASLQMRPFVDVEGSGRSTTVVTSSNSNVDGSTCTIATVVMANDSAIRDIKIVQRAPVLNGDHIATVALAFPGVRARAEDVDVVVGNDAAVGGRNSAVCTYGDFTDARLDGADVQAHNGTGQSNAVLLSGGRIDIRGSRLKATHGPDFGNTRAVNDSFGTSTITIASSSIETTGPSVNTFFVDSSTIELSSCSVVITATGGYNSLLWSTGSATITNTRIRNNAQPLTYGEVQNTPAVKIAASELPGDLSALAGATIVGSWNESFAPIPNQ